MSEYIDNAPNDDSFHPGENLLFSDEQLAPACGLLSYVLEQPEEEIHEFLGDFRAAARRGDRSLDDARLHNNEYKYLRPMRQAEVAPYTSISNQQSQLWGGVSSTAAYTAQLIQVDAVTGAEHEDVAHSILHDKTSPYFVGARLSRQTADLSAFRDRVAEMGGAEKVSESLSRLYLELHTQIQWAYVVQGINLLGGRSGSLFAYSDMQKLYGPMAHDALLSLRLPTPERRMQKIQNMQQEIAKRFAMTKEPAEMNALKVFLSSSRNFYEQEQPDDYLATLLERPQALARRAIDEKMERNALQMRADRAAALHSEYSAHNSQAVPELSGKARKRAGYEPMRLAFMGQASDAQHGRALLDNEANRVISLIHALRTMVEPSFDGVFEAHDWQQQIRDFEQAISTEYAKLGHQKDLPVKDSVAARLDWVQNNWDTVAGHLRAIPDFPVRRVAAALFPEVAETIQTQERQAEKKEATVAQRLGIEALDQIVVREVDWEILPVENIGERIRQEAARMTTGKRTDSGRRALQEVRVRDLVELSTLFDDAIVHVSREKDGITRRKNEPYFVITFTYGDKKFALAENLVLDNATFLLPESEFSWRDVFSLPRGAVGEFGAKRINHPSVDETGEYEGGANTHVNAIFAKLDTALEQA